MNREIKFRGKRVDNGEWIYGDVYHGLNDLIYLNTVVEINETSRVNKQIEVHPETVGQYTGLKDKDGNEIYEGDVLYHESHDATSLMKWIDKFVCFAGESFELLDTNYYYQSIDQSRLVIKSNIHDNPELINKI